jgi:hypothetical protein
MRDAGNDVLAFATADALGFFGHGLISDPSGAPVMPGAGDAGRIGQPAQMQRAG